jgi:2-polyprenyl-6-methoxyphenol hydroxylase-like FAD-dependent oxidoreductase
LEKIRIKSEMSNLKVLIVGASIAGPSAAYWFAKAGAKVTIIERFPQLRTNGQNVDIRTVGVTVMRKIPGMEEAVRAKNMPMDGFNFIRHNGQSIGTLKPTGSPDQQSLISEYEIFRGQLSQILVDLTEDNENVKYVFGEQVKSMQTNDEKDGPITVEFANGFPTSDYDLVVACDGANSRTRAIGLGQDVRNHIKPLNMWAAFFSVEEDILQGSKLGLSYSAVGGRAVGIGPDPSGPNQATLINFHPNNDPSMQQFREASKEGDEALKKFVVQHYKGAGWKTDQIMKGMLESQDFYASELVQVKLPTFHKGHFVLVGDAGYAGALGSGTSLAMAGAYVLAGEISRHKDDLAAGLKVYEERMRPIIDDLQKVPPFLSSVLAPRTTWGLWLRNNILAFICWSGILRVAERFFGGAATGVDKYNLPEYEWVA